MSPMFIPGPVDVDPAVLAAQTLPMLPHRSQEFETIFRNASEKAKNLFYSSCRVFITASSGTGLQEAAARNFARQKILVCVNGAFSERWYEVAVLNGKQVDRIEHPWNQPISAENVFEVLKNGQYEALLFVHNETSTGLENPVKEIAAAAKQASPDTLICVDAVSSLGGVKIEMDAWGLDFLLTSSQKCLGLPPGLGLVAVSDRALAYAKDVPGRGWYFDLVRMEKHRLLNTTPATPPLSLIYALDLQLDRILAEGLEQRFARHQAMANRVQSWAEGAGLPLYAPPGYRSRTLTTVETRQHLDVGAMNGFLKERSMRIANGYDVLKEITFRIAHMGDMQMAEIERLLDAMDEYLASR